MAEEINVDLSEIFSGIDDPKIDKSFDKLKSLVSKLSTKHLGKIRGYNAKQLLELFQEYEHYLAKNEDLRVFINMTYYSNMLVEESQALHNKYNTIANDNRKKLTFIRLEVTELIAKNQDMIKDPILSSYKNLLTVYCNFAPHVLTEVEEQLIIEKDQFGVNAWAQLQSKWAGSRECEFEIDDKKIKFHAGELRKYLTSTNREIRKRALAASLEETNKYSEIYSFAIRSIFNDWITISKRRNYASPLESSLKTNEINKVILDSMFDSIDKNVHLYQKTLKIFAKLLKLPKIASYDFSAPLPDLPVKKYSWEDAKELILEAFSKFDDDFVAAAKKMFDKKHIDATPRKGKAPGAWCARWYKGKSSFIHQTFDETKGSVFTLAHELGHAIHDYLAIPNQTIMNSWGTPGTAESASFFGELLLIDLLLEKAETKEEKIEILLDLVKRIGHIIWGLTAMYKFETKLYEAIENGDYLDSKTISNLWTRERNVIYGETVEWMENSQMSWATVPHYYMPNFRYYNYPYIFAQLFVYALYQQYEKEKEQFIPKFKKLLAAGGSLSPKELGEIVGLDLTKPEFWELGINQFKYFLNELEKLLD
ncbi:MAG: M3 family oligoendopeptidase [Asgard group archaeon]|nr:M3 family oligoendopeptidase [Asgard group archaeon]